MGQCLRGKMVEAGWIPTPATALADPAAAPAQDVAAVTPQPETPSVTATDIAAPALDVTPPADPADVPSDLIAATFGLLRAEPDGSVVIAGSGTPGSEIEVYSNDTLLGKAKVETSGDWVLVPDLPIAPGGSEITLGEVGKAGRAAQSFVVAINEDKTSEPLVVASTPGAISEVLQGLATPPAGTATQVAAADPVEPVPEPAAPAVEAPAPAAEPATSEPTAPVANVPAAVEPVEPTEAAVQPETPVATEPAIVDPAPTEPAVAETTPAEVTPAAPAETVIAAVEPAAAAPVEPVAPIAVTPPTIDAIELEGTRTFFAGAGSDGATMRLYVDDVFVADAIVDGGRWLVEAGNVLSKPSQRVRVDMLQPDSAKVLSRAEVNFVVDVPVEPAPTAVAAAEPPAAPEPAPEAEPAPVEPAQAEKTPEPAVTPTQPPVAVPADKAPVPDSAIIDAPAPVAAEPTTAPAEQRAADVPVATAETALDEPAPVELAPVEPVPAAEPTPAAPAPAVVADAVPTMVAVSVGGPDAQRFASGKAIIRRGDNLWTIARRAYGEGIKYTTIYEANTGQIRDPDRIYPGQVFDLPENAGN